MNKVKLNNLRAQGEIRIIDSKKTLVLPYIDPEYILKKKNKEYKVIKFYSKRLG